MQITIIGLGYVGQVTAACLADIGHQVIGVDQDKTKVAAINAGKSTIVEPTLGELIAKNVTEKKLSASTDLQKAIATTTLSFICVGTPSQDNGQLDLQYVENVCQSIGEALKSCKDFHTVVVRSTVLPGTLRHFVIPILERHSGLRAGIDFGLCFHPEFLREGSAVLDFNDPPKIVIGSDDARSADILKSIYHLFTAPKNCCTFEIAEMVKYADNAFHALKVNFANEIGSICKSLQVDGREVMQIFCQDTQLNLSPYYLKPGFCFGGSCLPKDVRALTYEGQQLHLQLPQLNNILNSNQSHLERAISLIEAQTSKEIGILGLSFKVDTDDLRESPILSLIKVLFEKGYHIRIYDKHVPPAKLSTMMHSFCDNFKEVIESSEIIIVNHKSDEITTALADYTNDKHHIIDLVGIDTNNIKCSYEGICW